MVLLRNNMVLLKKHPNPTLNKGYPMSMMIFNILFFLGLFVMFFFILRGQDILLKTMRNELAQTRAKLHLLEMRVGTLLGEDANPPAALQDLNMEIAKPDQQDEGLHLSLDPQENK